MPSLTAPLKRNLLAGILVLLPAAITCWMVIWLWNAINRPLAQVVHYLFGIEHPLPGLGLLVILMGIYLVGMLARSLVGRTLIRWGEALLGRLPLVGSLYGALKQLAEAFLSSEHSAFRQAVLIEYPRKGVWTVAFLTGEASEEIEARIDTVEGTSRPMPKVYCFVPTTPNPTSGYLILVGREEVIPLAISVDDALKLIISGGIVSPYKKTGRSGDSEPS